MHASSYTILPVNDTDIPRVSQIVCDAIVKGQHGIEPYVAATWPGLDTPEGRTEACSRFHLIRVHLREPDHFLKVVDKETGEIVAMSICFYEPEPPKEISSLSGGAWENEDDREFAFHLRAERNALLLRLSGRLSGPVTEAMAFFVDPSRQRQGIGSQLMKHLLASEAQQRKPLVLIAQASAVAFYEKHGLKVFEDVILPVPDRWQNRPPARLVSMLHEP